uniref:Uncharacterized protein n=1 Tax=Globodera rostochiensis TaxID=31243 RepID=A0A914H0S9_GLORO
MIHPRNWLPQSADRTFCFALSGTCRFLFARMAPPTHVGQLKEVFALGLLLKYFKSRIRGKRWREGAKIMTADEKKSIFADEIGPCSNRRICFI